MFYYIVIVVSGIYITYIGPFISEYECLTFKDEVIIRDIKQAFDGPMKYGMSMDRWMFNEIVTFNDYVLECTQGNEL